MLPNVNGMTSPQIIHFSNPTAFIWFTTFSNKQKKGGLPNWQQIFKWAGEHEGLEVLPFKSKTACWTRRCKLTCIYFFQAFVFQLEGKKKWSLYKPLQELAREYSPDLDPEEIGEKTHEIELEVCSITFCIKAICEYDVDISKLDFWLWQHKS